MNKLISGIIALIAFSADGADVSRVYGNYELYAVPGPSGQFMPLNTPGVQNIDPSYMMLLMDVATISVSDKDITLGAASYCAPPVFDLIASNPLTERMITDVQGQNLAGTLNTYIQNPVSVIAKCPDTYQIILISLNQNDLLFVDKYNQKLLFSKKK